MATDTVGNNCIKVDFSTINNILKFQMLYDEERDVLFLRPDTPRPATSVDWNGEIWLRVDIESGEVVGLEIDDFERFFLRKHPEIAAAWEQERASATLARRLRIAGKRQSQKGIASEPLIRIIMDFLLSLFSTTPCQARLGPELA